MKKTGDTCRYVIDGHNLLYALRLHFAAQLADGHPGRAAREALVEMLVAAFTGPDQAVRVYFDGGTAHAERRSAQVEVIYPGGEGEQRADKAILRELAEREADESSVMVVTVVTRDIKLARRARKRGARVMDPEVFFETRLARRTVCTTVGVMKEETDMSESKTQRFEELLEGFDHAMLVSVAADNSLHARPMAVAAHDDVAKLSFVTSSESAKAEELAERAAVTAVMQGDGVYLAVSGNAILAADRQRIEQLWQPSWKLWFPDGPEDPRLVLIELEPERAEYWDRTGTRRLEFLWQAGKALAKGEAVSDEDVPGHGQLSFD